MENQTHKIFTQKDSKGNVCRFYISEIGPSGGKAETFMAYQVFRGRADLPVVYRHTYTGAFRAARKYFSEQSYSFPMNLAL